MAALRRKSLALTDLFIRLVEERCAGHGLGLVTPREHAPRGSQVCLTREPSRRLCDRAGPDRARRDRRLPRRRSPQLRRRPSAGDILRFGFTPLYIGFEDVWHAVEHLHQVLAQRRMASAPNSTRSMR